MNPKATLWRLLAVVLVLGGTITLAIVQNPNLGLDLRGGTQITLEAQSTDRVTADAEATDRAVQVLNGRIDALGVAESTVARSGENRILIELPDVQDPTEAAEVVGQTATLEFREVLGITATEVQESETSDGQVSLQDETGEWLLLDAPAFDGNGISDAGATTPQGGIGQWEVTVEFNGEGAPAWRDLVSTACANPNAGQRIAIVLDSEIISSPAIQPSLCAAGGASGTNISGNFTRDSAEGLAVLIKGGALPVPVEIIDMRTVGPTLGAAAIDASILASIIGLSLTGLFIMWFYRLAGVMATIALCGYAVISYGVLIWIGATLTLPGLAGFVLAIGMAIDANVLVMERAREEYEEHPDRGLLSALTIGYNKAWSAIIDSNVTAILAALLLFYFASGPVRGFGITLTIGVLASMFSALVFSRLLTEWLVKRGVIKNFPAVTGIAGISRVRRWIDAHGPFLMKKAGTWVIVSLLITLVALAGIFGKGLNFGVEFAGGRLLEYSTTQLVDVDEAREAIADVGYPEATVQESSGDGQDNISVRVGNIDEAEAESIRAAIAELGGDATQVRSDTISPSLGQELRNKAIMAFAIAVAAQMLYLAWRFRWTWAAAAIFSMVSVSFGVIGVFAWLDKPIDGVFLAAILSVIGLSVNDTIVVFDRIRERLAEEHVGSLRQMVNEAIMATLPRTINTALGATFILAALLAVGGDSLRDFSLAVLLGLLFAHVSTVFTASSVAIMLEEKWPYNPETDKRQYADPYAHIDPGNSGGAVL